MQFAVPLTNGSYSIEVVGGLFMPTNECNRGGELLATGQLSNSSPIHDDTHLTGMSSDKETLPAIGTPCSPNKLSFVLQVS